MLQYQFRPIDQWPGQQTKSRKPSQFSAPWSKTLDLLERELGMLNARNIVIQAAVAFDDIRNDGMLRASARPSWPGVILAFDSKHGPLSYPCDQFSDWQSNVRAIALALEALRAVDRYGVTKRAEQYQGWAKLPGPTHELAMTPQQAVTVLGKAACDQTPISRETLEDVYRRACAATHPDVGGDAVAFKQVQAAKAVLDRHFRSAI